MTKFVPDVVIWWACAVAYWTRVYKTWSRFYQFLFERKYRNVPLPLLRNWEDVSDRLGQMSYRKDGLFGIGDVMSSAQAVEGRFKSGKAAGDCEDFAKWTCEVTKYSHWLGIWAERQITPHILMVFFRDTQTGKVQGHAVCAFTYMDNLREKWGWIDFNHPSAGWDYPEEIAENISSMLNSRPLVMILNDTDLTPKRMFRF